MFPAKFGTRVKWVKSCSTTAKNPVLERVSANNSRLSWNLSENTKIRLMPDVSCKICPENEMGRLAHLAVKTWFSKKYVQNTPNQFFSIDCIEICKKRLKFAWYPMFPANFGETVKWVNSFSTQAENTVLERVSPNNSKPFFLIDCLENCKKFNKIRLIPRCSLRNFERQWNGLSCLTRAEKVVLERVSANHCRPIFFNRFSWNLSYNSKILFIHDVYNDIWHESEVRSLSQLKQKTRFCKNYLQTSRIQFFH